MAFGGVVGRSLTSFGTNLCCMVRQDKNKSRVTAKGTRPVTPEVSDVSPRTAAPVEVRPPSPTWVGALVFGLLILGFFVIMLNYLAVLPAAPSNWYLLGGLGVILAGIIGLTQYR